MPVALKNISISNRRSEKRRLDGRKIASIDYSTAALEAGTVKTLFA